VVLTCEEVYIDEVDSCQVTGTFDVSHLAMDTAASIQSAVHQSTDNKVGGGGGGGGGYSIHWLPMAANRTLSKQLEELRNSNMLRLLPSQRIAVFTFYYLFDVINEVLTKSAEIMIANESSSSSTSSSSSSSSSSQGSSAVASSSVAQCDIPFVTAASEVCFNIIGLLSKSEFSALLHPFFFRVFIAKAGLRVKLAAQLFLSRYYHLFLLLLLLVVEVVVVVVVHTINIIIIIVIIMIIVSAWCDYWIALNTH
jgi:hypothetical protein